MRAIGNLKRDSETSPEKRLAWIREWQKNWAYKWDAYAMMLARKHVTRLVPNGETFDEQETRDAERGR